jgi:glyoxylase I family protein
MPESIVRPFRIDEIDHVVIRCADRERALKFYVEVLGLSEERRLDQIGLV